MVGGWIFVSGMPSLNYTVTTCASPERMIKFSMLKIKNSEHRSISSNTTPTPVAMVPGVGNKKVHPHRGVHRETFAKSNGDGD